MPSARRTIAYLACLLGAVACRPAHRTFEWTGDDRGWASGFADHPQGVDAAWSFVAEPRPLPPPLTAPHRALFIAGDNRSDDLFMFWKRRVTGLAPRGSYAASLEVHFASSAPKGCSGIGGAPGESVYVKLGASTREPVTTVDPDGNVRISIDKGNQATSGRDAVTVGDVATTNTDCAAVVWEDKRLRTAAPLRVTADATGAIWVVMGTDSGFEGRTEIYYISLRLGLDRVR